MVIAHIIAPTPALRTGLAALLQPTQSGVELGESVGFLSEWHARMGISGDTDVLVFGDRSELLALERAPASLAHYAVIMLTDEPGDLSRLGAIPSHGWAALSSAASAHELQSAVSAVARGLVVLDATHARRALASSARDELSPISPDVTLTPREQEVLELISRGLPNKAIAARLDLSESTIKFHLAGAFTKLGASSRAEAVSLAARQSLITL